jgi:antitoxin component of MazEF toxin-antitoxin module
LEARVSIRVYLSREIVRTKAYRKTGRKKGEGTFDGIPVQEDEHRRLYCIPSDNRVPRRIEQYVSGVSLQEFIPSKPHRTLGVYRRGDAEITVDVGKKEDLRVTGTARTLEDLLALYRDIRAGQTRPAVSWEQPVDDGAPASAPRVAS